MYEFIDLNTKFQIDETSERDIRRAKKLYQEIQELVRVIGDSYLSDKWAKFERAYSVSVAEPWLHMRSMANHVHTLMLSERS